MLMARKLFKGSNHRNWDWLVEATVEYFARYLGYRRRSLPETDVEFGYAAPGANPATPTEIGIYPKQGSRD